MADQDMTLCIGGPRDGQYVEHSGRVFLAYVEPKMTVAAFKLRAETLMERRETFEYRMEQFQANNEVTFFYIPRDWSGADLIKKLVADYLTHQARRPTWRN